jgi:excisionase family DNA binding protein
MIETPCLNGQAPKPPGLQPLLVDAREAARLLSISERTLWTLTDQGELPRVKIGRSVRYSVRDLERYIEGQRQA